MTVYLEMTDDLGITMSFTPPEEELLKPDRAVTLKTKIEEYAEYFEKVEIFVNGLRKGVVNHNEKIDSIILELLLLTA